MKRIVLASGNSNKVQEISAILAPLAIEVVPQTVLNVSEVEESGLTFIENALIKARHAAACTGLPSIADDSGIEVDSLNGAPGIYSARFAGKGASDSQNLRKLLTALEGMSDEDRTARFQCLIVYMAHGEDPTPLICQGTWEGRITHAPSGASGFGYDPIFYLPTHQCTAAELSAEEKNLLSHRGQALRRLLRALGHTE